MKNTIQSIALRYITGIKVEDLVDEIYTIIRNTNSEVSILNDKYLLVDGINYNFRRKNNQWTVQTF